MLPLSTALVLYTLILRVGVYWAAARRPQPITPKEIVRRMFASGYSLAVQLGACNIPRQLRIVRKKGRSRGVRMRLVCER